MRAADKKLPPQFHVRHYGQVLAFRRAKNGDLFQIRDRKWKMFSANGDSVLVAAIERNEPVRVKLWLRSPR